MLGAAALLTRAGGDEPPVTIPRDPAREAAERELSKPAYHENDPSLFIRALNKFWEWVGDLFSAASGAAPGGTVGLIVIVLAVLALALLLWWRLGTPRRSPASSRAPLFDDRPRSAADHRAAADAHAAQGHWNQAVQERMRALVRSLEERALLDPRPGRTADEAATEAARPFPAHTDALHKAARAFDDIAYGGRTATRSTYEHLTALDTEVARTTPALPSPAGASR
ncbi:DUF4129 domain-containing protein [Streptomyces sp. NPDC046939]|uniref:DUF4129 domain-containing protein n=1 Tax=Streptomyces sp. NPDC046939 TaxID=3155376 RepID=UPI0033DF8831